MARAPFVWKGAFILLAEFAEIFADLGSLFANFTILLANLTVLFATRPFFQV